MKTLGIIGGLGPMATAFFYKRITEFDHAEEDQEHFEILIHSRPSIPKRVEYILGRSGESPLPQLLDVAKKLESAGAEILAMPCITAHYFYDEIAAQVRIPMLHAVKETERYLHSHRISTVGILGTKATTDSLLIQNQLKCAGISCVIPGETRQEQISRVILEMKAGKRPDNTCFADIMRSLEEQGAETCLLACTELSVLHQMDNFPGKYVDMMDVLAAAAVRECGQLREEEGYG